MIRPRRATVQLRPTHHELSTRHLNKTDSPLTPFSTRGTGGQQWNALDRTGGAAVLRRIAEIARIADVGGPAGLPPVASPPIRPLCNRRALRANLAPGEGAF